MKLVCISDTHGSHHDSVIPDGDVLIHAGDCTSNGGIVAACDFLDWFGSMPHRHKILVAGNHDFCFENHHRSELVKIAGKLGITYLEDSGAEIEGVHFWGSPVQPEFFNWAFNKKRGQEINRHWRMIPGGTNVLITHGPPLGFGDVTSRGLSVGCSDLMAAISRIRPFVHVCGHIHEGYGVRMYGPTTLINASLLNEEYVLKNKPIEFVLNKITP